MFVIVIWIHGFSERRPKLPITVMLIIYIILIFRNRSKLVTEPSCSVHRTWWPNDQWTRDRKIELKANYEKETRRVQSRNSRYEKSLQRKVRYVWKDVMGKSDNNISPTFLLNFCLCSIIKGICHLFIYLCHFFSIFMHLYSTDVLFVLNLSLRKLFLHSHTWMHPHVGLHCKI